MESLVIRHLPKDREKLLTGRGVPQVDFMHGRDSFDVLANLVKYETDIPRMQTKVVSAIRQTKALAQIIENPLRSSYVLGISSFPSDLLAKHLAIHIMSKAVDSWTRRHKPGRIMPIWHRVFGGFADTLRDKPIDETPSMLVITNVNEASSAYKIEKVRDLLEKFSHVPRIVVMSGKDPLTFFGTKLYSPINAGILIGATNRIKEM